MNRNMYSYALKSISNTKIFRPRTLKSVHFRGRIINLGQCHKTILEHGQLNWRNHYVLFELHY
ncbi:unnamed protein product, partial [Nesidiocoris tenuis]